MLLHVLRGLFILLMAAVGWFYLQLTWLSVAIALGLGILFVCIDALSPRKKIAVFSGVLLGLVVGLAVAYALHFAVDRPLPKPLVKKLIALRVAEADQRSR